MPNLKDIEQQLTKIGCNFRFWGRAEIRELANVLLEGEQISHCINGQYEGGFAMLCATDQRVLLIDKKPMYLTIEDIRFDMVAQLDYNHRLMNATLLICTPNKTLRFTAYNQHRLRQFYSFVQQQVMEIRQQYLQQMQQPGPAAPPVVSRPQVANMAGVQEQPASPPQQFQPTAPTAEPTQVAATEFGQYLAPAAPPQTPPPPQPQQQLATVGPPQPQPRPAAPTMPGRMTAPIINAYTRLPLMSRQRRFLGSRAMNTPMPSIYQQQQR